MAIRLHVLNFLVFQQLFQVISPFLFLILSFISCNEQSALSNILYLVWLIAACFTACIRHPAVYVICHLRVKFWLLTRDLQNVKSSIHQLPPFFNSMKYVTNPMPFSAFYLNIYCFAAFFPSTSYLDHGSTNSLILQLPISLAAILCLPKC